MGSLGAVPTRTATPPVSRRAAPMPPGERRSSIIAGALPLLLERGVGVTSREIAAAAGVSEGTLFNVFADKDELINAAIDAVIDQAPFERAIAAIDPNLPLREQLVDGHRVDPAPDRRHLAAVLPAGREPAPRVTQAADARLSRR